MILLQQCGILFLRSSKWKTLSCNSVLPDIRIIRCFRIKFEFKKGALFVTDFCQGRILIPGSRILKHHPVRPTPTFIFLVLLLLSYVEDREYTPPDALPTACRRLFDTLGITRAVLIQPSVYGTDNTCMMESAPKLGIPARMIVVVPFETSDKELARLHQAGARGVRFILAHVAACR